MGRRPFEFFWAASKDRKGIKILTYNYVFYFYLFQGAFTYRGSMIDMPTMKQAQNIMKLAKLGK